MDLIWQHQKLNEMFTDFRKMLEFWNLKSMAQEDLEKLVELFDKINAEK